MSERLLREMFERMVVRKDASLIPAYYHPEFEMVSNGITQNYADFAHSHEEIYRTEIAYAFRYDDRTWVESGDRLSVRLWITTSRPNEPATELEIVLIAVYRDGLMYRLWELTWPDWSRLDAFEHYGD